MVRVTCCRQATLPVARYGVTIVGPVAISRRVVNMHGPIIAARYGLSTYRRWGGRVAPSDDEVEIKRWESHHIVRDFLQLGRSIRVLLFTVSRRLHVVSLNPALAAAHQVPPRNSPTKGAFTLAA
jgi:hypothetical protein